MKRKEFFIISLVVLGAFQTANAQNSELDMELEVTDEERIILFSGFSVVVIGIFLFLARDIVLRRKTSYDKEKLESKQAIQRSPKTWFDSYQKLDLPVSLNPPVLF